MTEAKERMIIQGMPEKRRDKVQDVSVKLDAMVRVLKPHDKLPGVRELSEMMDVSIVTLRKAVSVLERRNIIYQRQGSGIYVSPKKDQRHIVMLSDYSQISSPTHSPVWDMTAQIARERATSQQETFQFLTTSILDRPDEPVPYALLQQMKEGRVHGILGAAAHEITCQVLREQTIPFVSWGSAAHGTVSIDYSDIVRTGVRALVTQGCKNIALWQSVTANYPNSPEITALRQKLTATFRSELKRLGLTYHADISRDGSDLLDKKQRVVQQSAPEQGYYTTLEIFAPKNRKAPSSVHSSTRPSGQSNTLPDGVVIVDDMMTQGAMTAFSNLKIEVGQKVHVASYANKNSAALLGHEEKLFLLQIDPHEIIGTMFTMLETLMDRKDLLQQEVFIKPRLITPHFLGPDSEQNSAKMQLA